MIPGYRHMNVISSVLLLTALVLIFVYGNTTPIPLILLVVSLACSILLILHRKEWEEEIRPDERTRKIGAYALSYAWWIGISGIILLFWSDSWGSGDRIPRLLWGYPSSCFSFQPLSFWFSCPARVITMSDPIRYFIPGFWNESEPNTKKGERT